jgi:hypothetical protein
MAPLLFSVAPVAVYYSTEGRMYALVWFLSLVLACSTHALAASGRGRTLGLWIASASAGLLTHYFFVFVWAACVAWLWLHPGNLGRRRLAVAVVATAAIVAPWYVHVPDSVGRWRVTAGWLGELPPIRQLMFGPVILAWKLLSGRGIWGGAPWADWLTAAVFALLAIAVLTGGAGHLFRAGPRLLWLWLLAVVLGPVSFDLLQNSGASMAPRYGLPGLPAAMLFVALALSRLSRRARLGFLALILVTWAPGFLAVVAASPRAWWEPYPLLTKALAGWGDPRSVVIVHSIPSGVLGVARYASDDIALASWVVQLGGRRIPEAMEELLAGRCRVALVKVHYLGQPSPAEAWLRQGGDLVDRATFPTGTEILFFLLRTTPRGREAGHRECESREGSRAGPRARRPTTIQ